MHVPERVPRNTWLFDPIAGRRKHAVVEVLLVEWRPAWRAKHQAVRRRTLSACSEGFQKTTKKSADGDNAVAASSFRRAELTIRIRLGDFDCAVKQVYPFPAKSKDLPDS